MRNNDERVFGTPASIKAHELMLKGQKFTIVMENQ